MHYLAEGTSAVALDLGLGFSFVLKTGWAGQRRWWGKWSFRGEGAGVKLGQTEGVIRG